MIDGLSALVGSKLDTLLADHPRLGSGRGDSIDDMIDALPLLYSALDEIGASARAVAAITLARGGDQKRRERRNVLGDALAPELAHLEPSMRKAIVETLHMLGGTISWFLLTRSGDLTASPARSSQICVPIERKKPVGARS